MSAPPAPGPELEHIVISYLGVISVHGLHGQCSWSTWSVFMVHVVSIHGHHVTVSYNII